MRCSLFNDLAVLQYPATACIWKLKATATYRRHGCFRLSNMSILTLLSCQPPRNSFKFDSFTYKNKYQTFTPCLMVYGTPVSSKWHKPTAMQTRKRQNNINKTSLTYPTDTNMTFSMVSSLTHHLKCFIHVQFCLITETFASELFALIIQSFTPMFFSIIYDKTVLAITNDN